MDICDFSNRAFFAMLKDTVHNRFTVIIVRINAVSSFERIVLKLKIFVTFENNSLIFILKAPCFSNAHNHYRHNKK
jgi:hypothetical protein